MRLMAESWSKKTKSVRGREENRMQSFRDFTVVYAKVGEKTTRSACSDLGRAIAKPVEGWAGLSPGESLRFTDIFLPYKKAEHRPSPDASHDH